MPFKYPKRLSELSPIKFDSDEDEDQNDSNKNVFAKPTIPPKKLLDSFELDESTAYVDSPQSDQSSCFDENKVSQHVNSSTPIGKENYQKPCPMSALSSNIAHKLNEIGSDQASTNNVHNNMPQYVDNLFATPSMKPPPTTGRIIFSSSQQKLKQSNLAYQKTLFETPKSNFNRQTSSNTSDYVTDSFSSFKKTSILSPIDEDKISADDLHAVSANDDGTALTNKIIEINKKDFIINKKIGCGGSCSVYSAKCRSKGGDRALKVVNLRTAASNVESYLNEAKLLEKLQGSDCVIKLFEYLHCPDKYTLFLVMEMGEGDLHKLLKSYETNLPLNKIVSYWYQMLTAVKYIHDNGIIHSDLKPANFLLVNGRLKLIDFGIASNISVDATSVIKFSQTGTLNYISPEALIDVSTDGTPQKKNKYKISTKSDVWSLGCIFYLCVYRRTPFSHIKNFYAKYLAITSSETVIDYPQLPAYYPPMLEEIIKSCLHLIPKERSSVAELLQYPFAFIDDSIVL
ncbi:Dual specificity protein kinase Ttk [Pseudolycoriella hygida]|uniref:Dual specificity protein kinase Ttk n=1 Tax=Pseudolycoriella hygida TaxID=35572 RepID=A0A9Q0MJ96_9DIPT|nr:Dual specificity protein kinase Ttk [Pseudolycoriella hygida]